MTFVVHLDKVTEHEARREREDRDRDRDRGRLFAVGWRQWHRVVEIRRQYINKKDLQHIIMIIVVCLHLRTTHKLTSWHAGPFNLDVNDKMITCFNMFSFQAQLCRLPVFITHV
ncbi:hypothetical protein ACJX0J_025700 [Zea mays]